MSPDGSDASACRPDVGSPAGSKGLVALGLKQRLAADREDQNAQEACDVLGQGRDLSRLEDVVEEQEIYGEKAEDQANIQYSSHGSIVDQSTSGFATG